MSPIKPVKCQENALKIELPLVHAIYCVCVTFGFLNLKRRFFMIFFVSKNVARVQFLHKFAPYFRRTLLVQNKCYRAVIFSTSRHSKGKCNKTIRFFRNKNPSLAASLKSEKKIVLLSLSRVQGVVTLSCSACFFYDAGTFT